MALAQTFVTSIPRDAQISCTSGTALLRHFTKIVGEGARHLESGREGLHEHASDSVDCDESLRRPARSGRARCWWEAGVLASTSRSLLGAAWISREIIVGSDLSVPDHPEIFAMVTRRTSLRLRGIC